MLGIYGDPSFWLTLLEESKLLQSFDDVASKADLTSVEEVVLLKDSPRHSDAFPWISSEELLCSTRAVEKETLNGSPSMPLTNPSMDVVPQSVPRSTTLVGTRTGKMVLMQQGKVLGKVKAMTKSSHWLWHPVSLQLQIHPQLVGEADLLFVRQLLVP